MSFFDADKIVDARRFTGNAKATIQNNGRLGFSADAAKLLNLETGKSLLVSDIGNGNFAAVIRHESDERGFKIQKGGEYFYARMKNFFDLNEIDYANKRIIYDISETRENYEGNPVFRLNKRTIEKKETDEDNE